MKRRRFMKFGLGCLAIGSLVFWKRNQFARFAITNLSNGITTASAVEAGDEICVLTREQTAGPYYTKSPMRSNITEERPGLPLKLDIEIVQMPDCTPLEGVTIEIWQCDVGGHYSGYSDIPVRAAFDTMITVIRSSGTIAPNDTETFMRGGQVSDAKGMVQFETIFPGWYDPRVAHIHVKVSRDGESFLTTQLYFPDELLKDIYSQHPDYIAYGPCPYTLENDPAMAELGDGAGVILKITRDEDNLAASVRLGIA